MDRWQAASMTGPIKPGADSGCLEVAAPGKSVRPHSIGFESRPSNRCSQRYPKPLFAEMGSDRRTLRQAKVIASRHTDPPHHASEGSLLLSEREFVEARDPQFLLRNRCLKPEHHRPIATCFDDGEMIHEKVHHHRKIKRCRVIEILVNDKRFSRGQMRKEFGQHLATESKCFSHVDKEYLDRHSGRPALLEQVTRMNFYADRQTQPSHAGKSRSKDWPISSVSPNCLRINSTRYGSLAMKQS